MMAKVTMEATPSPIRQGKPIGLRKRLRRDSTLAKENGVGGVGGKELMPGLGYTTQGDGRDWPRQGPIPARWVYCRPLTFSMKVGSKRRSASPALSAPP